MSRQLLGIRREPGTVLDHAGHRIPVEMAQAVAAHDTGDNPGEQQLALWVPIYVVAEIGTHLEQLRELGVEMMQHVVDHPIAE